MSRLIDDIFEEPVYAYHTGEMFLDSTLQSLRHELVTHEVLEISDVLTLIFNGPITEDVLNKVDPLSLPSIKPPWPRTWIEGSVPPDMLMYMRKEDKVEPLHFAWPRIAVMIDHADSAHLGVQTFHRRTGKGIMWGAFCGVFDICPEHGRLLSLDYTCLDFAPPGKGTFLWPVAAFYALSLLHCRNVVTEMREPSTKLQRARQRRGKRPLFRFRELAVQTRQHQIRPLRSLIGAHRDLSLHTVRGHFKTFTPDHPAFGRVAGTFWCPPFMRGHKEFGVVEKDYVMSTKE